MRLDRLSRRQLRRLRLTNRSSRGKSGLWILLDFVPIVGPLWSLIELGFLEGTQGPNEFDEGAFSGDYALAAYSR